MIIFKLLNLSNLFYHILCIQRMRGLIHIPHREYYKLTVNLFIVLNTLCWSLILPSKSTKHVSVRSEQT